MQATDKLYIKKESELELFLYLFIGYAVRGAQSRIPVFILLVKNQDSIF